MRDFLETHGNGIIAFSSLVLITILTGVLISATGKALVLEFDGLSLRTEDSENGERLKFYAE